MQIAAVPVEVQVAAVTGVCLVIAALVAAIPAVLAKRSSGRVESRLGDPNGKGDLVAMVADVQKSVGHLVAGQVGLVSGQADQDKRLADLEGGQHTIRRELDQLMGRVDVLERRTP